MRNLRYQLAVVIAATACMLPAAARGEAAEAAPDATARPRCEGAAVNLNFVAAALPDVVRFIAETTGERFILSGRVPATTITIVSPRPVSPCEAYQAFVAALAANRLTVVRRGRYLLIVTAEEAVRGPIPVVVDDGGR